MQRRVSLGGQDQFYLEGQIAMALPQEDGGILVYSSTQHPDEVQRIVAHATQRDAKDVVVICRRMGGAFGGKESQAALIGCIAALAADKTGRPCKLRLDRDDDMIMTGKRHDFRHRLRRGLRRRRSDPGHRFRVCGALRHVGRSLRPGKRSRDVPLRQRVFLENVRILSHRCKTNTVSNTAFRGFGGPQGMFAIEYVIDDIARTLGKDPLDVRRINFYGKEDRNVTHYQQVVEDNIIDELFDRLLASSDYENRREDIHALQREPAVFSGVASPSRRSSSASRLRRRC